ncbi:signal transduction protein [Sporosarcina sp. ITBMC105]
MRKDYDRTLWEDRVINDQTGLVMVEGTPVDETNMNNIEDGIQLSHLDIGLVTQLALHFARLNGQELEKYKKQRILQGSGTITSENTNGYFRSADPFTQIGLSGFAQLNAPNYDVQLSIVSGDAGLVGNLEVYDKTQNGFKVRMTGSAKSVSFIWTLINPNAA